MSPALLTRWEDERVVAVLQPFDEAAPLIPFTRPEPEAPAERVIAVPANVRCWICRGPLFVVEEKIERQGEELQHDVYAFPVCPGCAEKGQDPEWVLAQCRRAMRARQGIHGLPSIGTSDGVKRGRLTLVQREDDDDDEPPEGDGED